jgi:formate hydrogenlyase regulatory protein HycA
VQQRAPHGDDSVLSQARIHLAKLLRALPRRSYTDIAVRPFQRTVDGVLFGLLVEEDEDGSWAELYPDRHAFGPPWDGTYDT